VGGQEEAAGLQRMCKSGIRKSATYIGNPQKNLNLFLRFSKNKYSQTNLIMELNFSSETPSRAFSVTTYITFMAVSHKVTNSRHLLKLEPSKDFDLIAFAKLAAPDIFLSTL
jgi:hypothetical protein